MTVMVAVLVAEVAEIKVKNKCVRERQKVFYMLVYCTEQLVLLPIMALILLVPIVLKAFRSPSDIGGWDAHGWLIEEAPEMAVQREVKPRDSFYRCPASERTLH